jgi:glyoxylase-like metal-dependent hydrolase (beta-lactamase superfamily II)
MEILAVDCNYVEKEFAASFLLVRGKSGLFVECNTTHAIPYLKEAALKAGLTVDQVQGLIITHVHLDHAGGAGAFLREFPNAKLYAHPKAARHAIDPSKLIASATAVYGEATMKEWYGTIFPCEPARVVVVQDGDEILFQDLILETKHLRGHANHHLVVFEPETQTLFSGDSFGVAYPEITKRHSDVILASTSPTDFDGIAAIDAVNWIEAKHPHQIALTHFGFFPEAKIKTAAQTLRDQIQYSMDLMQEVLSENLTVEQTEKRLQNFIVQYFKTKGVDLDAADLKHLHIDLKVNAQGIHYAANAKAKPSIK